MKMIDDINIECTTPLFLSKTSKLLNHIKSLEYSELKSYLKCSDTIAQSTYDQFQNMRLDKNTTPAILSYSGIQYQYMAPHVFTDDQMKYIQQHLYILSGFYGLLKPLDAITPYRLEMQTKCPFSLYDFWKDDLAKQMDEPILNLASEEYAKIIRKYKPLVDVRFIEENGKEKHLAADTVISAFGMRPNTVLADSLKEKYPMKTRAIGDCYKLGKIGEAVREGFYAASSLD